MKQCIFCQIVKEQIPCYKVYEDGQFLGFLDIYPLAKGHSLVIPKKHYRWVVNVPQFARYWEAAGKVAKALIKSLQPASINFATLGFEVPHAHIHVIPRFVGDDLGPFIDWTKKKEFNEREMREIAKAIKFEIRISKIHQKLKIKDKKLKTHT